MHAQLVGAAREGLEFYQRAVATMLKHTILSDCPLAVLVIDHLARTVVEVGAQWQVDNSFFFQWFAIEQGDVGLAYGALLKLLSQSTLCLFAFGKDHQSARRLVKTVDL